MVAIKFPFRSLALIAVIVFSAAAVPLAIFWQRPPQQVHVTAPARLGDIENAVLATGRLDAIERVNVGARVSGEVKSLKVKLGDRVTKGQSIADIDDLQQRNDLRTVETELSVIKAELQAKQAQLKQAESRFKRQRRMLNDEASSLEDFEAAETTLATIRAELLSLNARLVQAQI
ncbi:biotin/lipoyl-binding protein, partial [Serratia ureilytica]|uniref:biotin/lipoyl-binding protein n=1 Tax=Serratia ureilytica TaxID=300181 RepID=UPI0018E754B9